MSNYTIPPRLRANDYAKGKLTQDEIISLQISNDANIAKARKAVKMGEVAELSTLQAYSPEELIMDVASQEASARANIEKLGFRPQEASIIINAISNDPQLDFTQLNYNFPAIEADIRKRFNVKLLTPTFFVEYFRKYSDELLAVAGVRIFNGRQNSNNELVNNVAELRDVLPDAELVRNIARSAARDGIINRENVDQLNRLASLLPNSRDLREVENMDGVSQQRIIQDLLDQFKDLPSRAEIQALSQMVQEGRPSQTLRNEILALIDATPVGRQTNIVENVVVSREPEENYQEAIARSRASKDEAAARNAIAIGDPRQLTPAQQAIYAELTGISRVAPSISQLSAATSTESLGSAISLDTATMAQIKSTFRANPDLASKLIGPNGEKINYNDLQKKPAKAGSRKFGLDDTNIREIFQEKFGRGLRRTIAPKIKMKVGKGLAVKQTPSYREYGKYAIHIPQLEQQDILNVKYKSLGQIPKFRPVPVSDIFRDFIIELLENGKPNGRIYNQIPEDERKLFEEVSIGAGVWNGLGLKRTTTSTDEEENKNFELLKGEYMAGNNSPKVIGSLRQLVVKMMNDGRIRRSQGVDLLMELSV
jgi:hypothetical protein